jgi:hypothetical protein
MESTDHYMRRHNVDRFCKLLDRVTDETQRETLLILLAEEQQKQTDAGDPLQAAARSLLLRG